MNTLFKSVTFAKAIIRRILSILATPQAAYFFGELLFGLLGFRCKGKDIVLSKLKRILVVRLDEIGDVVMTTSFLRELRRNLPDAWITLVIKPAVYNLVELCPYVNEILTFDWNIQGRFQQIKLHKRALNFAWKHLWKRRFSLAIIPRWDFDHCHATFVTYFSGATWRLGYSENVIAHKKQANENFDLLLTHIINDNTLKHEVEHNLDVISFLGGTIQEEQLEIWLGTEDEAFADQILNSNRVSHNDILFAFGIGAGEFKRMWSISNFIELGIWLKGNYDARILVIGGLKEKLLGEELQQQLGNAVINVAGLSTLRQTGALLKRCHIYIGNDAGQMHLAVAAQIPVIEISCHPLDGLPLHSNSPRRFGPWKVPNVILQPEKATEPCSGACISKQAHCILGVPVHQVKDAVVTLLSQINKARDGYVDNIHYS